jgi:hypothetical protein
MHTDDLEFYSLVGLVIFFGVLHLIISGATRSKKRALYEWAQMELLDKIARVQGVPEEEIKGLLMR